MIFKPPHRNIIEDILDCFGGTFQRLDAPFMQKLHLIFIAGGFLAENHDEMEAIVDMLEEMGLIEITHSDDSVLGRKAL